MQTSPTNKKWYLAARTRYTQKLQDLAKILESKNQQVTSDWIYKGSLKPFGENKEEVEHQTVHNTDQMLITDVLLLILSEDKGSDIFTEFGVCLGKKALGGAITIYIVGNKDHASMMQWHPDVIHCATIEEVFAKEGIDTTDITFPDFS